MGVYVTNQNVIDRVGVDRAVQLTTDSGAVPDTDLIDEMIVESEGEANSYIAKRFDVPVDLTAHPDVLAVLRGFVIDLVVYRLGRRRPPVKEDVAKARADAIEWFEKVASGKANLPAAVTPASTNADDPAAAHGSYRDDAGFEDLN